MAAQGPKGLERSSNEKGSGGVGNISNRSEDEVFKDAVAEFPESGYSSVTGEHTRDVKEQEIGLEFNKATAQTSKDGSINGKLSTGPDNLLIWAVFSASECITWLVCTWIAAIFNACLEVSCNLLWLSHVKDASIYFFFFY